MIKKLFIGLLALSGTTAMAGGLLTNSNQSVAFDRNFARDGAIGIDGVYSNPAGVAFLEPGFHASFTSQTPFQERKVKSTFAGFAKGVDHMGQDTLNYTGKANAPIAPSLQLAYNTDRWSFQFGFAITGGGGKCTFDDGLGSFESIVSLLPTLLPSEFDGYDADIYMKGRQYYFGGTLGAAYKVTDNLSVYGGMRTLYGYANYYGYVKNIQLRVKGTDQMVDATDVFEQKAKDAYVAYTETPSTATAAAYKSAATLAAATQDVTLNCDETGWGVAPILGIDYKLGKWNFGAKYEFQTVMWLKNKSANSASADNLSALSRYKDGKHVREDSPAMFTIGTQYEITPALRAMASYHLYFDKDATSPEHHEYALDGNSMEYLLGVEWDVTDRLLVSAGGQRTVYDFTDAYMNDMIFNVNSYSVGLGGAYKITKNVKLNLGYFMSFYGDYTKTTNDYNNLSQLVSQLTNQETADAMVSSGALSGTDVFTRTNYCFSIGVDVDF